MGAESVQRNLTRSVLSSGRPSASSMQALHRLDLADRFESEPAAVLAELHAGLPPQGNEARVFALAELCFLHALRAGDRRYFLAAALYAYAFLFPQGDATPPGRLDPRLRLAADLYNRGLTTGLDAHGDRELDLAPGPRPLPFGSLELSLDEAELRWGGYQMTRFFPVADVEVIGLRNRYRRPGIGAPLAADVESQSGKRTPTSFRHVPSDVKVAVTAFLPIDHPRRQLLSGQVHGQLRLYTSEDVTSIEVEGHQLPLEYESSSALAFTLGEASFSGFEFAGFFSGKTGSEGDNEGILMLSPYRRGRIPVVLVHGTASAPSWWANLLNELQNDPGLRDRYQFWLFRYGTGTPIVYSAGLLHRALTQAVAELDPAGSDPALQRMVLVGHSQGGLLAKLAVVESGTVFWDAISDRPIDEYDLDPETRELLERSLFFSPLPFVRRVIYMATPHGGSFRASPGLADLLLGLVTFPVELATLPLKLLATDESRLSEATRAATTSVHAMTPGSDFLVTLAALDVSDRVATHSIIAVNSDGPVEEGNDGVVKYQSAHIEDVESELVVRSSHSVQLEPLAIEEVDRILREHLAER